MYLDDSVNHVLKATTIEMNGVGEAEEGGGVGPRTTLSFPFLSLFQWMSALNGMKWLL